MLQFSASEFSSSSQRKFHFFLLSVRCNVLCSASPEYLMEWKYVFFLLHRITTRKKMLIDFFFFSLSSASAATNNDSDAEISHTFTGHNAHAGGRNRNFCGVVKMARWTHENWLFGLLRKIDFSEVIPTHSVVWQLTLRNDSCHV